MCGKIYCAQCLFSRCFYDLPPPLSSLFYVADVKAISWEVQLYCKLQSILLGGLWQPSCLSLAAHTFIHEKRRENTLERAKCVPVYTTWDCCESLVAYLKKKKKVCFRQSFMHLDGWKCKTETWHEGDHKIPFHCLVLNQVFWARVSGINSVVWITTQNNKSKKT